jgi:ArsR family transcriptional regulator
VSALSTDLELLSDPVRARLLALLGSEELSVGELTRILSLPQPTISRQLKSLLQGEWLIRRTVGTAAYLRLGPLDATRQTLWGLVREDPALANDIAGDQDRLARIVAEREDDAGTFFGRVAAGWDTLRDQLFGQRFLAPAVAALLPHDAVVVDLGCGTGHVLAQLAPFVSSIIGVDREPGMLAVARQRAAASPNAEIVEASLEAVPLPDALADLALCVLVLHHLAEPSAALAEARRLLRPTGKLVVVDMQPHDNPTWRTFGHLHQGFSVETLTSLAADADLAIERLEPLPPDPDAQGPPLFVAAMTPLAAASGKGSTREPSARRRRSATMTPRRR